MLKIVNEFELAADGLNGIAFSSVCNKDFEDVICISSAILRIEKFLIEIEETEFFFSFYFSVASDLEMLDSDRSFFVVRVKISFRLKMFQSDQVTISNN